MRKSENLSPNPKSSGDEHVELVAFDDLSLAEMLGLLWRHPRQTLAYILAVLIPRQTEEENTNEETTEVKTTYDILDITALPEAETAQPDSPARPGMRRLLLIHIVQCAAVIWLWGLLLTNPDVPGVLQLEQTTLILWMVTNSVALLRAWRGRGERMLQLSEGFLTLLSMLALLQWAGYAGNPNFPAYISWAGALGTLNLALNLPRLYGDNRIDWDWLSNIWAYGLMVSFWLAFGLAVAAGRIMLGAAVNARRSPDIFYHGLPFLYASMAVWAIATVVVWRRTARRIGSAGPAGRPEPAAEPPSARQPAITSPTPVILTGAIGLIVAVIALTALGPTFSPDEVDLGLGALAGTAVTLGVVGISEGLLVAGVPWWRIFAGQMALGFSSLAYAGSAGNLFTVGGVLAWAISIVLWWLALRDPKHLPDPRTWWKRIRAWWQKPVVHVNRTLVALLMIIAVGAFFRFHELESIPPEMTSDHVEKLLDSARVFGDLGPVHLGPAYTPVPQIFFPNNGGREPIQMYLVSFAAHLTGWGFTFNTLKIVSVIEGLVTLPLLYWMGKELANKRAGLLLAGLVAVSFWHTMLSRLALRIVLMPLCITLLLIYLVRAMRHNRRADYLKAGLVLGAGMYAYQGLRMAPLIVLVGVGLAMLAIARSGRDRLRYTTNLMALIAISLAVFVPMGRVMLESPEDFWRRTSGRLGVDESGVVIKDPLGQFVNNYNDALWMFNWKSDVQWISNVPNRPQLDPFTGALFTLGVAGALMRLVRQRDPVEAMLLLTVLIMLLPSALSIAQPQENPSATRASGTLPVVYLWAALALDTLLTHIGRAHTRTLAAVGTAGAIFASVAVYNYDLFFDIYRESYAHSADPYSHIGDVVRGFAESLGSMETVFIVAYPHWLDHRAVGLNANDINWVNMDKLLQVEDLPQYLPETRTLPLMILYNQFDTEAAEYLAEIFPEAIVTYHRVPGGDPGKDFYIMIVPPDETT